MCDAVQHSDWCGNDPKWKVIGLERTFPKYLCDKCLEEAKEVKWRYGIPAKISWEPYIKKLIKH